LDAFVVEEGMKSRALQYTLSVTPVEIVVQLTKIAGGHFNRISHRREDASVGQSGNTRPQRKKKFRKARVLADWHD
jgi:hypothetical protein